MSVSDDDALEALLDAGTADWVSLDDVIWEVAQGDLTAEDRARVLRMFDRLYGEHLAVPGDLGETGFEDWAGSPAEWLDRTLAALERHGWAPRGAGL